MTTLSQTMTVHRGLRTWQAQALWVLAAAGLGFATTAVFSSLLGLPRYAFVGVYAAITLPFIYAYLKTSHIDVRGVLHRSLIWWIAGAVGAVLFGGFMVMSMLRQPASPRPEGLQLVVALLWLGILYGVVDALLLTVLPVVAAWKAFKSVGFTTHLPGRIAAGAAGWLASAFITVAYHAGFTEYRDADIVGPIIGNTITTLGFLLTTNPFVALVIHITLHVVSVLHGIDTTPTLPPHY